MKTKTPRHYISWSQMNLFERSPASYTKVYLDELPSFSSEYTRLGSKLADRLETGEPSDDPLLEHIVIMLPKYKKYEHEIMVDFEGIPLRMMLDGFNKRSLKLGEYKTSKNKWTQKMVDKCGQITFYVLGIYLKYGRIPRTIRLTWVETIKDEKTGKLGFTGKVQTFKTKRTLADLLRFRNRIKKAWKGIKQLSKNYAKTK